MNINRTQVTGMFNVTAKDILLIPPIFNNYDEELCNTVELEMEDFRGCKYTKIIPKFCTSCLLSHMYEPKALRAYEQQEFQISVLGGNHNLEKFYAPHEFVASC